MSERLLTTREAAAITGMSVAWFERKRWSGGGPEYIKVGAAVRYKESTLRSWFDERVRISTSDAGASK